MVTGRVVVQQWISLDGLAAGPGGEGDLFMGVDPTADERSQQHNLTVLDGDVTVLLGRRTYEQFVAYWPTATETIATAVNAVPKVVLSRSLQEAAWGSHARPRVAADAAQEVRRLVAAGGTVLVWGSLDVVGVLLGESLVDELDLFVTPVVLGSGRGLLPSGTPVRLRQLESEDWGSVTHLRYAVER